MIAIFAGAMSFQSCTIEEDNVQVVENDVYEFTTSFNYNNNYSATYNFSRPLYQSDHILVYRLWGKDGNNDVWRLIPNTVYFTNGDEILYNNDFTRNDFRVFLEPNFDVETLSNSDRANFVSNQTFRVVVVPGRFAYRMDFNDYDKTIKALGYENAPIKKL